jgi:hypothetical protein
VWETAKRLKREGRSLGCHPCNHFSLTSRIYLTVPPWWLQQPKPSISTKSNQTGIRIKHYSLKEILDKGRRYKSPATSCSFEVDDPQEIQERDLLRVHLSDYYSLIGGSYTSVIDIKERQDQIPNQTLRANPKKD